MNWKEALPEIFATPVTSFEDYRKRIDSIESFLSISGVKGLRAYYRGDRVEDPVQCHLFSRNKLSEEATIARIRTDYVHEQQSRYRTAIDDLEKRMSAAATGDRVKLGKQLKKLQEQAEELRIYEEKIHHLADQMIPIDLDDGVKVNYAKFQDVVAKIK